MYIPTLSRYSFISFQTILLTSLIVISGGVISCSRVDPQSQTTQDVPREIGAMKGDIASWTRSLSEIQNTALSCSEPLQSFDPNGIHDGGNQSFFEGWYYRFIHPQTQESWVIIVAYWANSKGKLFAFIELLH